MNSSSLTYAKVDKAVQTAGSIRGAAKLLKKSPTALQWWLARHGLTVERRAVLVPIGFALTDAGREAVKGDQSPSGDLAIVSAPEARQMVEAE